MLTDIQKARMVVAIQETQQALARAIRYSPDLRDHSLITFYEKHIRHLTDCLKKDLKP